MQKLAVTNATLHYEFAYSPSKLEVMDSCIRVSGVIASFSTEVDGDYYVQITLNPQFNIILTQAGFTFQAGTGILNQASR
jgi:hypothetical protein